jgi:hypothetical protein
MNLTDYRTATDMITAVIASSTEQHGKAVHLDAFESDFIETIARALMSGSVRALSEKQQMMLTAIYSRQRLRGTFPKLNAGEFAKRKKQTAERVKASRGKPRDGEEDVESDDHNALF